MFVNYSDQAKWLSLHWLSVLGIIIVAVIVEYIGEFIIKASIRRFVHGRHLGRPNQALVDVKKRQDTIISISVILWKLIVFVGAGFAIFGIIFPNVNLLPFLASAGVIGAIIGFGAQSIIRDLISGSFIIIENQFRVGDDVEINGASGTVEHITLRSTVIRDDAGNVHYIANGNIIHVINKSMGFSKLYFTISVTPNTDIDALGELIKKLGEKMFKEETWHNRMLEPPKMLNIGNFSDQAVEVRISGQTKAGDQSAITTEFKKRLLSEIKKNKDIELSQYQDISSVLGRK